MWFFIVTTLIFVFIWMKKFYNYFEDLGFPYVPAKFPFGSMGKTAITEHLSDFMRREYENYKNKSPAFGIFFFFKKTIIPTDPQLVKEILVKNFEIFHDHGFPVNEKADPLANNLFFTKGQQWKDLRAKLSPTFTSGRMKMMFPIVASKADRMIEYLKPSSIVEIKEIFSSFTTESIASVSFGIETECLGNPQNPFRTTAKLAFEPPAWENIKAFMAISFESFMKFFNVSFMPKEVTDFFMGAVKDTMDYREKNNYQRDDFMQLTMNIMKNDKDFTFDEMAANCFIFFFAGFETSSSALTFMSYELALNQDIQERLRDEINEVLERHNGEVTYDAIMEMKYLDMVFNETLRKWPIVDSQIRKCDRDFKIPNTDLIIEAGNLIMIPAVGLHLDERFWDEPEKFDPERFNEENVKKIVPYSYIPFGDGPRICIGQRFGVMQTKIGIVNVLKNFKLTTCSKTLIPMKMTPTAAFQSPLGGMWLKIEKI